MPITTTNEAADRSVRRVARAFLALVDALTRGVKRNTDPQRIPGRVADLFRGSGLQPNRRSMAEELRATFEAGAEAGMYALRTVRSVKAEVPIGSVAAEMSFSLLNPSAIAFLQGYEFELITGLTSLLRETIQGILVRAYRDGITVQGQARLIRQYVGLTPAQVRAVENYRRLLESGDPGGLRDALARELRDARFDSTLQRAAADGARLTRAQIERLVARYVERQVKYRATMIARTETIRAANAGQIEAWRQAQQQGLLSNTVRMKWIVTKDERTCDICPQIRDMNPGGVLIGGVFRSPKGIVRQPPDPHPQCRCALGLLVQ